ncbi:hypothetical protein TNCV_923701 [Trichonephila clavipes]|nr:hypothetical protein TNCV_923701 [Trichonephila clavipes]
MRPNLVSWRDDGEHVGFVRRSVELCGEQQSFEHRTTVLGHAFTGYRDSFRRLIPENNTTQICENPCGMHAVTTARSPSSVQRRGVVSAMAIETSSTLSCVRLVVQQWSLQSLVPWLHFGSLIRTHQGL